MASMGMGSPVGVPVPIRISRLVSFLAEDPGLKYTVGFYKCRLREVCNAREAVSSSHQRFLSIGTGMGHAGRFPTVVGCDTSNNGPDWVAILSILESAFLDQEKKREKGVREEAYP